VATISLGLGRAYLGLGKLVLAQAAFLRAVNEPVPPNASTTVLKAVEDAGHCSARGCGRVAIADGRVYAVQGSPAKGSFPMGRDINRDAFFVEDRGTAVGSLPTLKEHQEYTAGRLVFRGGANTATPYDSAVFTKGAGYFIEEDRSNPLAAPPAGAGLWVYAPASVAARTEPIEVVLLFGVGAEMFRHGICRGFDGTTRVLFNLPGTEAEHRHHWGAGITRDQIDTLLGQMGFAGRAWGIRTFAAFSTGYRGCWLTIRNSVLRAGYKDTGLAPKLANLQKLVIFDCVCKNDETRILNTISTFEDVLVDLDALATGPVRVVANDLTQSGGTWGDRTLPMNQLFTMRVAPKVKNLTFEWNNLRETPTGLTAPPRLDLQCLAMARRLREGVEDSFFTAADLKAVLTAHQQTLAASRIDDLLTDAWNVPHGTPKIRDFAHPVAQFTNFPTSRIPGLNADARKFWITAHKCLFEEFVQRFALPGWAPWSVGEFMHDSFLAELGPQELAT
jgi:hypothetical protein